MKSKSMLCLFCALILFVSGISGNLFAEESAAPDAGLDLDAILDRTASRFIGSGYEARFDQTATISAMDITDTAFGRVFIKYPNMMRWEYEAPEQQTIITDGNTLWIHRPTLNQVMIAAAPDYLKNGKGASFLADIRLIHENFSVLTEEDENGPDYILNLLPINQIPEVSHIRLFISKSTFEPVRIITYNPYGDETRIDLTGIEFHQQMADSLFTFTIPEGMEVLQLSQ